MILTAASSIYGAAVARRCQWYDAAPSRRRRLSRPVVSVGNLRVGGAGKTPIVAAIARLLSARGERPAILLRGYAREVMQDGVTVVSDGEQVLAGVETAGDEALMLARQLTGVPVLVGADRYLSGRLAERRFGATLHLLDDGFQHLALARDADLLVVDEADLSDALLPAGRLREPLTAAARADALLTAAAPEAFERFRKLAGGRPVFGVSRQIEPLRLLHGNADIPAGASILAVAGIARPQRFFDDLTAAGWRVAAALAFADHHIYRAADMARIDAAARAAATTIVLTTEKDAVRMKTQAMGDLSFAAVPLAVTIAPAAIEWLLERIVLRSVAV